MKKKIFFNNLRCLLLVYAFYLDMIECINISDKDLRLLNYFSEVPNHQRHQTDEVSDDE